MPWMVTVGCQKPRSACQSTSSPAGLKSGLRIARKSPVVERDHQVGQGGAQAAGRDQDHQLEHEEHSELERVGDDEAGRGQRRHVGEAGHRV